MAEGALILYRAVSEAEYADWRGSGRLRSKMGGMEGKHFTDTVEHALSFAWSVFLVRKWETGSMFILKVSFDERLRLEPYEMSQDRVGPAYFADDAALESIRDVRLICSVKDER